MKRTVFFAVLIILSLGASAASPVKSGIRPDKDNNAVTDKTGNKLTEEELSRLTRRVEEIRDIDKSALKAEEKKELRKELKGIKENLRRDGGYIYIGGGTLLLILILIILLV